MTTFLKISLLIVGVGLAGWLAVIAYDLGTDFRRFTTITDRSTDRSTERSARRRPARVAGPTRSASERAEGVV